MIIKLMFKSNLTRSNFCWVSKETGYSRVKTHIRLENSREIQPPPLFDALSLSFRSFSMYTPVTTIKSAMSFPAANISSEAGLALPMIPNLRRWNRATGVLAESFKKSYDSPG